MSMKATLMAAASALMLCSLFGAEAAEKPQADRKKAEYNHVVHRASEIQGMTVENEAHKELGTVSDIVIDVRSGKVKYAALSYGGLFGLGDKLFAVPWGMFKHFHDADDDTHTLVIAVSEETLKNAPGFDQDKWPNFADKSFVEKLEKHYGTKRKERVDTSDGNVKVKAGDVSVKVKTDADQDETKKVVIIRDFVHRADTLLGMTVKNGEGKTLGSVNDLVIDMNTGKVRYAAVSYGGFLGLGDKLFAVPWQAFKCKFDKDEDEYFLVLGIDESTLKNAPGFDQEHWPDFADPKFSDEVDEHYDSAKRNVERRIQ